MRLSPTWAHQAVSSCTTHTAPVARGRWSSGSCRPISTISVCACAQRQVQERQWIEQRLRQRGKARDQRLAGDLRGARAIGMATHAIEGADQCSARLGHDGNTILVLFAGADQADFGIFDLQNRPPPFG